MKNKKFAAILIIVFTILLIIVYGSYIAYQRTKYAITDAVFVESNGIAYLSFKRVSGKIVKILKDEGDKVKKGDVLAELDDKDYRIELKSIQDKILSLVEKKKSLEIKKEELEKETDININVAELSLKNLEWEIKALKNKIKSLDVEINLLKKDEARFKRLLNKNLIPKRKYEDIKTKLEVERLNRKFYKEKIKALEVKRDILKENINLALSKKLLVKQLNKEIKSLVANINVLKAKKEDIELKLKYTKLKSPVDGVIAKRFKSVGDVISSGMPVFAVIPDNSIYILVLLEEGKLKGVKKGNKAYIKIDAYPDKEYIGVVEEINPATASKFALVPRDITAGEFTKVEQRIPVKIKIIKGDISMLKVGMGGEVKIERK